jgi:hypothetical protein
MLLLLMNGKLTIAGMKNIYIAEHENKGQG